MLITMHKPHSSYIKGSSRGALNVRVIKNAVVQNSYTDGEAAECHLGFPLFPSLSLSCFPLVRLLSISLCRQSGRLALFQKKKSPDLSGQQRADLLLAAVI